MNTIDRIVDEISKNQKINRYKELEAIINNNVKIKTILDECKKIQKEIVHAENLNKPTQLKLLNEEYNLKMDELSNIPLLMEYLDLQKEINDFLQNMTSDINQALIVDLGDNKP